MDRCDEIKANVRMEERYAGISFTFDNTPELRTQIETAIKKIKKQTGMTPQCFDNSIEHKEEKQALYIEFSDEVQRDSGAFFELILKELHIEKCANDVVDHK